VVRPGGHAVMSAEQVASEVVKDQDGRAVYRFRMDKRIPPYLFALAVGDISFARSA
jgi:aminopeptidase N